MPPGGRYTTEVLRVVCGLLVAPGNRMRSLGLRGTALLGLAPGAEHAEGYTLAGVALLCQARALPPP